MKRTSRAPIAILLMAGIVQCAPHVHAATETWRCGNTYTDQPCTGGKAIDLDDARDAARKREADSTTREARAAADRMERDRVRQETALGRKGAVLIDGKPRDAGSNATPAATAIAQKKKKDKKDAAYFSAHDPVASEKKKAEKAAKKAKS